MCGIAFVKGEELHRVLGRQRERGLDGIGISWLYNYGYKGFHPNRNDAGHYISEQVRFEWYIDYIKKIVEKYSCQNNMCLLHHRKASVGKQDIENNHPVTTKKFSIMQNGTEKLLRQWGDVEGIDPDKTDTYCLAQFLTSKAKNLMEVIDLLDLFENKLLDIGVLLIVDVKTNNILFYSDGKRESYITFSEDKRKINKIESWTGNDRRISHKNVGWVIFNFDGDVLDISLTETNLEYNSKTSSYSYTDDNGETKYQSSYTSKTYERENKKIINSKKNDQYDFFLANVIRSINKGDVYFEEIKNIPEGLISNRIVTTKAIKRFKKTYEQALKRAKKFSKKIQEVKDAFNINLAQPKLLPSGTILDSIDEELDIKLALSDLDDAITLETSYDNKSDTSKSDEHFKSDLPKDNINSDTDANSVYFKNRIEYQDFLSAIDWLNDVATSEEILEYTKSDIKITSIDMIKSKVTISKKHYFTETVKIVDLNISNINNGYYIINPFSISNNSLWIKINDQTAEPILCS